LQNVYVYGDDTLVPASVARDVMKLLEACSLKYNKNKCFIDGKFRESCGTDAFKGEIVTPLRVKTRIPTQITDAEAVVAWVKMGNQFAEKGMWQTYAFIKNRVESIPKLGRLPHVPETASILGWCHESASTDERWKPERRSRRPRLAWAASAAGCENKTHSRWREVDDSAKPYIQGVEILGWSPEYTDYDGGEYGLSELGRYFRFVSERTDNSNTFGERYSLTLKRRRYVTSMVANVVVPKVRCQPEHVAPVHASQSPSWDVVALTKCLRRRYAKIVKSGKADVQILRRN
jgi:hypothetical protein